jgi:hypothetical protein
MIKNWRPISLLSCFYKVVSKAVNRRLDRVIDKLTSLNQKAYNKRPFIHEAVINTVETIRHCENNNVYRSCIALFYRKRLPQQQRDRWIGERETSTHWLHVGRRWVRAIPPHPPLTCDKRQGLGALWLPPPSSIVHKQANS